GAEGGDVTRRLHARVLKGQQGIGARARELRAVAGEDEREHVLGGITRGEVHPRGREQPAGERHRGGTCSLGRLAAEREEVSRGCHPAAVFPAPAAVPPYGESGV